MNILFYSPFDVSPQKGGTERITYSVSNALRELYGHKCFLSYGVSIDPKLPLAYFDGRAILAYDASIESIKSVLNDFAIDVVIIQGAFGMVPKFRTVIGRNKSIKLLFVHHFEPGWEKSFFTWHDAIEDVKHSSGILKRLKKCIKLIFFPYFKSKHDRNVKNEYKQAYQDADKVVLLSLRFEDDFLKICESFDSSKITAVPNMLSFSDFAEIEDVKRKKNIVLIVSRLEETQKRISIALDIWNEVKKDSRSDGWELHILGMGRDAEWYGKKVGQQKIPDVLFHGVEDPREMYAKSSLFMMTSRSEGWGLTLTESMQYGCVPLAFDSYASLHDIILDGVNGVIVKDNDVLQYASKLIGLMEHPEKRFEIAHKAILSTSRFSKENVAKMWNDLWD